LDCTCGIGRIPEAAWRACYTIHDTDIVDRGYAHFSGLLDFLQEDQPGPTTLCVTHHSIAAINSSARRSS
jgi:hypothetical protein